jgi:hypothetical protein
VRITKRTPAQRVAIGLGVLAALALIGAGGISVASGIVIQSKDTTHTVLGRVSNFHVDVDGDITVQTGPVGQITVTTHRVWSFHEPTVTETHTGTDVTVTAACHGLEWGTCNTSVNVVVPAATDLNLTSHDGNISVDGVRGDLTLQSDDGDVNVTSASGSLHLTSDNGNVSGSGLTSTQVQASSDSGDVGLSFARPPESVNGSSDNGSVSVSVPHGPATYSVSANSDNGSRSVGVSTSSASDRQIAVDSEDGAVSVGYTSG